MHSVEQMIIKACTEEAFCPAQVGYCGPMPEGWHTAELYLEVGLDGLGLVAVRDKTGRLLQLQYTPSEMYSGYLCWERGQPFIWKHKDL